MSYFIVPLFIRAANGIYKKKQVVKGKKVVHFDHLEFAGMLLDCEYFKRLRSRRRRQKMCNITFDAKRYKQVMSVIAGGGNVASP